MGLSDFFLADGVRTNANVSHSLLLLLILRVAAYLRGVLLARSQHLQPPKGKAKGTNYAPAD